MVPDDVIQAKVFKFLNLDNFYRLFVIVSIISIIHTRNYLDISYFLLITFNYIRIKIHQSSTT